MSRLRPHTSSLIAAICLVGQALALGHFVMVEHARCAEHGEMVHAADHSGHAAGQHADASANSEVGASDTDHTEAHDHCAATSDRRAACALPPSAATGLAHVVSDTRVAPVSLDFGCVIYCIAPKTSPPG